MPAYGMLRRKAPVRTDVSEELSVSIIRVTRIDELRTLAITRNRRCVSDGEGYIPLKRRFLQELHGVTSHKTARFKICGICRGQSGTGEGLLRILRFPLPIINSAYCSTIII
jgi:hypothetical protein